MDYYHSVTPTSVVAIIAFPLLFLFSFLSISRRNTNLKKTAPEAGGAWPIIGHLRLLGGPQPPHISLGNMADKYGRMLTIKLGARRALVVSSWEIAKECLTIHDKAFATRPKAVAQELLSYNHAMIATAPYGPYWRQMRKFATIELLSNHRLNLLKHVRESEVKTSLQQLYQLWNKKKSSNSDKVLVEMKRWFRDVTLNVILMIVVGKRIPNSYEGVETVEWKKSVDEFFELSGKIVVADALPFLRWLDIGGEEKRMNKSLVLAAEDTTSITMTWALALLLNNRDALNKVQQELDIHVGKDKLLVTESDTKNLMYLQSIIKETLRLYPPAPLSATHEAIEDCTVDGYDVSPGTWLIFNLHKIHRDPHIWTDPSEFRPERFMTTHKDFDVRGQNFELIPFGSGRRMCPGISFALQVLQLTLANVLHWFEFETPSGEAVDMHEAPGLTSPKATPLEVYISPRLPASVYNSTT
ncbi:hypothetical protein Gotur_017320 [Gossypium turneri]